MAVPETIGSFAVVHLRSGDLKGILKNTIKVAPGGNVWAGVGCLVEQVFEQNFLMFVLMLL